MLRWRAFCPLFRNASAFNLPIIPQSYFYASPLISAAEKMKTKQKKVHKTTVLGTVEVWQGMTTNELCRVLQRSPEQLREALAVTKHPNPDKFFKKNARFETIELIVALTKLCGYKPITKTSKAAPANEEAEDVLPRRHIDASKTLPKPPVVTIMGHVDHGKTSLLDALRKSRIVQQEHGGITQHIGAFSVPLMGNSSLPASVAKSTSVDRITFLDTPGHAAFAAMRSRGAKCTDLVILVVAADDGVMPQTIESIRFAKEADVPILVAINKIDKGIKDFSKIKYELAAHGVLVEDLGGDVQVVPISALKSQNLDLLLEAILAQVEVLQLAADPTGPVQAVVVEAKTLHGKGKVATCLVQHGSLSVGDHLVAGLAHCRVRTMSDDLGNAMSVLTPGCSAEITGWRELPSAGDFALQVDTESRANDVIRLRKRRSQLTASQADWEAHAARMTEFSGKRDEYYEKFKKLRQDGVPWRQLRAQLQAPEFVLEDKNRLGRPNLTVVLKADTDGTLEAVVEMLQTYQDDKCMLDLALSEVGHLTSNDLAIAETFNAVIYLFHVDAADNLRKEAKEKGIAIREHRVIYHLAADVKAELQARVEVEHYEEIVGEALVKQLFYVTENRKKVSVLGCMCTSGTLNRKKLFRVIRPASGTSSNEEPRILANNVPCKALRHLKTDVETINRDVECGLFLDNSRDVAEVGDSHWIQSVLPGDIVQCYDMKQKQPELSWELGY